MNLKNLHLTIPSAQIFIEIKAFIIQLKVQNDNFAAVKEEIVEDEGEAATGNTKKKGVRSFCIDDILSYKTKETFYMYNII